MWPNYIHGHLQKMFQYKISDNINDSLGAGKYNQVNILSSIESF